MSNPKVYDLHYTKSTMFIMFVPQTKAGEEAWKAIAAQTDGTGKIFPKQLESTLAQLRKAGYTVRKAPKMTEADYQKVYDDLDELLGL